MKLTEKGANDFIEMLGVEINKLNTFLPNATKPIVLPNNIGVNSRVLHYWRANGLLKNYPPTEKRSDWVKLNLMEVTWLKIVQNLLEFGISMKVVKAIGLSFNRNLLELFESNASIDSLLNIIDQQPYDLEAKKLMKELIPLLKQNPSVIDKDFIEVNTIIGSIVCEILLFGSKVNIYVYHEENEVKLEIVGRKKIEQNVDLLNIIKTKPHLTIPVNGLLEEFIINEENEKYLIEFGLISNDESKAIEAIRNKDVREITIKKDDEDKITMTTSSHGKLSEKQISQLVQIFGSTNYHEVRLVMKNKKDIFLEGKKKYKL